MATGIWVRRVDVGDSQRLGRYYFSVYRIGQDAATYPESEAEISSMVTEISSVIILCLLHPRILSQEGIGVMTDQQCPWQRSFHPEKIEMIFSQQIDVV